MSNQAKEVISWFSAIAQNKTGDEIFLQDIPGHSLPLKIHKNFYLFITGNNP